MPFAARAIACGSVRVADARARGASTTRSSRESVLLVVDIFFARFYVECDGDARRDTRGASTRALESGTDPPRSPRPGYSSTAVNSGSIARAMKTPNHGVEYDVSNHTVLKAGDPDKRAFTYFVLSGGRMIYASALRLAVLKFLLSMSASADVLALASLEVDLSKVELGSTVTVKWRGKPVFIRRRTPTEIAREAAVDVASLRDPQSDAERAANPEWLVAVGVCTHLGCVPIANAGDYNGWFCPCHGSHYDASGAFARDRRRRTSRCPSTNSCPETRCSSVKSIVPGANASQKYITTTPQLARF